MSNHRWDGNVTRELSEESVRTTKSDRVGANVVELQVDARDFRRIVHEGAALHCAERIKEGDTALIEPDDGRGGQIVARVERVEAVDTRWAAWISVCAVDDPAGRRLVKVPAKTRKFPRTYLVVGHERVDFILEELSATHATGVAATSIEAKGGVMFCYVGRQQARFVASELLFAGLGRWTVVFSNPDGFQLEDIADELRRELPGVRVF